MYVYIKMVQKLHGFDDVMMSWCFGDVGDNFTFN